jgi:hypothetical protein
LIKKNNINKFPWSKGEEVLLKEVISQSPTCPPKWGDISKVLY